MSSRTTLPPELSNGPFTVARARALALTRGRTRGPDLTVPTRGVRRARTLEPDAVGHATAFALALPGDCAFSHVTAARLLGLPTPTPWPGAQELLDVIRDHRRPPVTRAGCRSHRGLESRAVTVAHGLRVTSAVNIRCDLVGLWPEPDLLAVGDVLLRRGLATSDSLLAAATARSGRRRAGLLPPLAHLARAGAASPAESIARWWFWRRGPPEPELSAPVHDHNGQWLATVDFRGRARRTVGEYDGDVHRTDRRDRQRNEERRALLEDEGWSYVDITSLSLSDGRHRDALRARLVRLLGSR